MKKVVFILVLAALAFGARPIATPPTAEISNGLIHARLYLPDPETGYYRGSRFDWSGVVASLEYEGHNYFGPWFKEYSPTLHDAISGPVEAFDPIGYDIAKAGETFLKIGVGLISKSSDSAYAFFKPYPIVNPGKWQVFPETDQVKFIHTLNDQNYSYEYTKIIKLSRNKPEMEILHTLKNTGRKTLETLVYNHNFFVLDNQTTGPDFAITFPFDLPADPEPNMRNFIKFKDRQILFLKALEPKEHVYIGDMTQGKKASYALKIENQKKGMAIKITSNQLMSKIAFWCSSTTVCPEPFTNVKVDPGKEFFWKLTYVYTNTGVK